MKILVCVKEVPEFDVEAPARIDKTTHWSQTDQLTRFVMNRFDEYAVEEALLIKKAFPDTTIDAITVGPERAALVVRRALGMGVDNGIHIVTEQPGYLNPFDISSWIATHVKEKQYDLILTGVMSEDAMQGQVSVMTAEYLSLPCATSVMKERVFPDRNVVLVEREIEGGFRDVLEITLPCLLTIQSGINQPRYPVLSKMLRAKKATLEVIAADALVSLTISQSVVRAGYPQKQRNGEVLEGSTVEKAERLIQILHEKSLLVI